LRRKQLVRLRYGSDREQRGRLKNSHSNSGRPAVVAQWSRLGDREGDRAIGDKDVGELVVAVVR